MMIVDDVTNSFICESIEKKTGAGGVRLITSPSRHYSSVNSGLMVDRVVQKCLNVESVAIRTSEADGISPHVRLSRFERRR